MGAPELCTSLNGLAGVSTRPAGYPSRGSSTYLLNAAPNQVKADAKAASEAKVAAEVRGATNTIAFVTRKQSVVCASAPATPPLHARPTASVMERGGGAHRGGGKSTINGETLTWFPLGGCEGRCGGSEDGCGG